MAQLSLEFYTPDIRVMEDGSQIDFNNPENFSDIIPKWDKKDRDIDFLLTGGTNRLRYAY